MATGLLSNVNTGFPTLPKPYSGPAISTNGTLNSNGTVTPSLGVQAKAPATAVQTTTLPANQISTAPKPTVQASTDGGTASTTSGQAVPAYGSNVYSPQTGALVGTAQFDPNTGAPLTNPNVTNVTGQAPSALPNVGLYGQLINQATNSVANNAAITAGTQNEVNQTAQEIAQLQQGANTQEQAYQTGMIAPRAQGLAQNVASTEANQQTALQGQLSNELTAGQQALTGQQQTQTGLLSAAGLAAPQVTSYGQTSFNPVTQQFDGGGSLPASVLQQYAQMAASGQYSAIPSTITQNPVLSAQLNAAAQAINPAYTPIASSAQGAATATNIQTLGTAPTTTNAQIGAQNQTAAANLSTQLQQFSNLSNTASNFLQSNLGLNPTQIPAMNQSIGTYLATVKNPAAAAAYSLIANDITGLQTAILGSYGNTTPTAAVQATLSTNPSTLPINQLQTWITTLNQLGSSRLAPLQSTSSAAYGSGTTPYAGTPTTANTSTSTVTPNTAGNLGITPLNADEAAAGTGIGILGSVENFFGSLGSKIASLF